MIAAHQHFGLFGQNDCAWPTPDLTAIHRDYGPDDLKRLAAPEGVRGSVLVQSQPSDRDTDWLLALAADEPFVLGVVGWADLAAPQAPTRIAELAAQAKLKGLRPMLQDLDEDDWILRPALSPALAAMAEHGLVFDALIRPRHLRHLATFADRHPGLAIVVDHAAKPAIAAGAFDPWRSDVEALSRRPNVTCKLSGLVTEAGPGNDRGELAPYVAHLLAGFGPERLMWGSDWPVLELAGDYAGWLADARALTGAVGKDQQASIFENTARRVYRL
jgi:L-fuconolactonase